MLPAARAICEACSSGRSSPARLGYRFTAWSMLAPLAIACKHSSKASYSSVMGHLPQRALKRGQRPELKSLDSIYILLHHCGGLIQRVTLPKSQGQHVLLFGGQLGVGGLKAAVLL